MNHINEWCFEVKPYKRIQKREVVKRVFQLHPDLKIEKINILKSKRALVILKTDRKCPYTETSES